MEAIGMPKDLQPYFVALVSIVLPVLIVAFAPAAVYYFRRLIVEIQIIGEQLKHFHLTDCGSIGSWPSVQSELRALLRIEANRRLQPIRMARANAPPSAIQRLLVGAPQPAPSMRMAAAGDAMVFKDLLLVGGGHAHAHTLKVTPSMRAQLRCTYPRPALTAATLARTRRCSACIRSLACG